MFNDILGNSKGSNSCKNIHDLFFELMDDLIYVSEQNRFTVKYLKNKIGIHSYLREYCTIKVNPGRQVGKSEYIKRRATNDDLVIVCKHSWRKGFLSNGLNSHNIVSYNSFLNRLYNGEDFNRIYIDEYTLMRVNKSYEEKLFYKLLGRNNMKQTFIFLG